MSLYEDLPLTDLDKKAREVFGDHVVVKSLAQQAALHGLPRYVSEYLIAKYVHPDTWHDDLARVQAKIKELLPDLDHREYVKDHLLRTGETTLIDYIEARVDLRNGQRWCRVPAINDDKVRIEAALLEQHPGLLLGGLWGTTKLRYSPETDKEVPNEISAFTPFQVGPPDVAAYRDAWRLLLQFVQAKVGKEPSELDITDLDAPTIVAFLDHLEQERRNGIRTRNARLSAVRSFFRFAALRHPEHAAVIARVLDIPAKRCEMKEVDYLDRDEIHALIAAPDRASWCGRRDHALLSVAVQTGLRVSELTGLRGADVGLGTGAHVRCTGKGRKERCTPLDKHTVALLRVWLQERGGGPDDPLFPTRRGSSLTRSAVRCLVAKHAATAARQCPSLQTKHTTPHTLRHSCAMELLHSGVDSAVIALWLGHEQVQTTVRMYIHGDLAIKERALARTRPATTKPGRYKPPDALMAFLATL